MKKLITWVLTALLIGTALPTIGLTESKYAGLTLEQLQEEYQTILQAMWKSDKWQEVRVPAGVYTVGEEIPAGEWTINPADAYVYAKVGTKLDATKADIDEDYYIASEVFSKEDRENGWTITLLDGFYVIFNYSVYFTPPVKGGGFTFK